MEKRTGTGKRHRPHLLVQEYLLWSVTAPPADLEQATEIASVGAAIEYDRLTDCPAVSVFSGRLSDGTPVRLFALIDTGDDRLRDRFERCGTEWERYGTRPGVTSVHARGDQPVPWIAVEQAGADTFEDRAPSLAGVDRRSVLAALAETLWQLPQPHLVCHPARVWIEQDKAVRLDWAVDRLCLGAGEADAYLAPEVRKDPNAGDQRSDVYTVGAFAQYARTGTRPELEPTEEKRPRRDSDRTTRWLERRAMHSDPEQRFDSCYAFKRAVLFGTDETADPGQESGPLPAGPVATDSEEDKPTQTGNQDTVGSSRETGAVEAGQSEQQDRTLPASVDDVSRRQVLGATAIGTALIGTVGGVAYWQRDGPDPDVTAATDPELGLTATFEDGIIGLRNSGASTLDPEQVTLTGVGFTQPPGERLAALVGGEERFNSGDRAMLAADPAYELTAEYRRNGETTTLLESEGPEAGDRDPPTDSLYTPNLVFGFEPQDNRLRINYSGPLEVRGDHIQVIGSDSISESGQTWGERVGSNSDDWVSPGDAILYESHPAVVVRIEWAPPYLDDSTTLAQYEGPARPRDKVLGGVSGPRYDMGNTGTSMVGGQKLQEERWSAELDGTPRGSFAVDSGRLFSTGGSYLYAFDAIDGAALWRRYIGSYVGFSPVVADGTVFVTMWNDEGRSTLFALDARDGSTEWRFEVDSQGLWPPTITERVVFTGGAGLESGLFVLDRSDGSQQTTFEETSQVTVSAFDAGSLYVRNAEEDIAKLTPNGVQWTYPADGHTPPTASSGSVFCLDDTTGGSPALVALDPADGSERWQFETADRLGQPQAVANGVVFAGGTDGTLYAVGADTGDEVWTAEIDSPVTQPPVVTESRLYVTSENRLSAFSTADGERQTTTDFTGSITTEPAVVDQSVFVGTTKGQVVALGSSSL